MGTDMAVLESRARVARIVGLLVEAYGRPHWLPSLDPLSELIATILSQHTSDVNSHRAFANLRATFLGWDEVRNAPVERIGEAIRTAGMARSKAPRIKEALEYVASHSPVGERLGCDSLAFLAAMDLAEAKAWLRGIPGVGPKTAACVLMFAMDRPALPVDTHVHRITRRLGLIDDRVSADGAHETLEAIIPADDIYTFHVNLVWHGRRVCRAQRPRCTACNLDRECRYRSEPVPQAER